MSGDDDAPRTPREQSIEKIIEACARSARPSEILAVDVRRLATEAADEIFRLPAFEPLLSPATFKALGHPARRRIIELVHERGEVWPVMAVASDTLDGRRAQSAITSASSRKSGCCASAVHGSDAETRSISTCAAMPDRRRNRCHPTRAPTKL